MDKYTIELGTPSKGEMDSETGIVDFLIPFSLYYNNEKVRDSFININLELVNEFPENM